MKRWTALTAVFALAASAGMALAQDKEPGDSPKVKPSMKMEQREATLKVGDKAPALEVEKWVKGDAITGFEKGRVYVVEFWATWCPPCIHSMPHLTELQREFKDKGLTVVGVTSEDPKGNTLAKVEDMVAAKGERMGYVVGWDKERKTSEAYMTASGQSGIPTAFVVDQKGVIAFIGHPLQLDLVLGSVVDNKWDVKTDPARVSAEWKSISEQKRAINKKAEDDPKAALKMMDEFDAKYPKFAFEPDARFDVQLEAGDPKIAATADKVVDGLIKQGDELALNDFAWKLVDPEAEVKNPPLDAALRAALKAVEIGKEKDGAVLDTLARVYWLKHDKAKAIEVQRKAVALADDRVKDELEARLKEYEAGSKN